MRQCTCSLHRANCRLQCTMARWSWSGGRAPQPPEAPHAVAPEPAGACCRAPHVPALCSALTYLPAAGICHRDSKPQNLRVDPKSRVLQLCDFGSAQQLPSGEPNISHIRSRHYRAPELIFGATDYSPAIDGRAEGRTNSGSLEASSLEASSLEASRAEAVPERRCRRGGRWCAGRR